MCRATRLCCFNCLQWFGKTDEQICQVCGDWRCPNCHKCLCNLTPGEQKVALAYMATYENLLKELTGESYDFGRHRRILAELGIGIEQVRGGTI